MFDINELKSTRAGRISNLSSAAGRGLRGSFALLAILLFSGLADAKTVYVNEKVAASGKGGSWATAFKYLRDALDETKSGDQIFLAKGVYFPDDGESGSFGDRELSFELDGQKLYGGFAGTETSLAQRNVSANPTILSGAIWDGADASDFWSLHVVLVSKDSTLDGLIVEDGHANGAHTWNYPNISSYDQGGGCYVESGNTLTLANCIFRNNRALADGGAILLEEGSGKVVATNCTFDRNEIRLDYNVTTGKSGGGAIKGNVEAKDCRFTSNSVATVNYFEGKDSIAFGGAIAGSVKAVRCEFTANEVHAWSYGDLIPTADGGAIAGNFSGTDCSFSANEAFATEDVGISAGGAISGETVHASNCSFTGNSSGTGFFKPDETTKGGGGAVYMSGGESSIANCIFAANTSEFRGGAVQAGVTTDTDSIFISNCTFLDNGVPTDFKGAALSCGGVARILNCIFWFTAEAEGDFERFSLIQLDFRGALRNSDENYPTPSSATPNIIKGGLPAITQRSLGDLFLVSPSILILDADPLFANATDLDGADNRWGTPDDGLRLMAGSAAIGKALDSRVAKFVNVLPKDKTDADLDGNLTERLPIDLTGFVRVQDRFVELGAYEYGEAAHVPEIAVFQNGKELFDGGSRKFGKVAKGKRSELIFTIKSTGTNGLKDISFEISGSKEFTVKKTSYTTIDSDSEATFTVVFGPKSIAKYSAKLRILSSDANESPFDITLTGQGAKKGTAKSLKKGKSKTLKKVTNGGSNDEPPVGSDLTVARLSVSALAAPRALSAAGRPDVITTKVTAGGLDYLMLTVQKSTGWSGGTVQVSSDLMDWFSGSSHTTTLENSATLLRVRDNTPIRAGEKRFIRLK